MPDEIEDGPVELSPEERQANEALSAWLDEWAESAARRVPLPEAGANPRRWASSRGLTWGALAASIAALLLLRAPDRVDPMPENRPGIPLRAHDLEVASPYPYMLVPTRDPSISIVWILDTPDPDEGD